MDIRHLTGRVAPDVLPSRNGGEVQRTPMGETSFKEVLEEVSGLKFSRHALDRLEKRSISMGTTDMKRLEEAVRRAGKKGAGDSLVLDGDQAFLVNIPNKTVITAVDMMELRDKVFTNIDSTVLTRKINN